MSTRKVVTFHREIVENDDLNPSWSPKTPRRRMRDFKASTSAVVSTAPKSPKPGGSSAKPYESFPRRSEAVATTPKQRDTGFVSLLRKLCRSVLWSPEDGAASPRASPRPSIGFARGSPRSLQSPRSPTSPSPRISLRDIWEPTSP